MIKQEDINILKEQKSKILIEWWLTLNHWDWPKELPNEERPIYKNIKYTRRSQIMHYIKDKVGLQLILRTHNRHMTVKEFRDFWRGTHFKSKKAYRRYIKRIRNPKYIKRMKKAYLRTYNKPLNLTSPVKRA